MTFEELKRKAVLLSNDEAAAVLGGEHPWDSDRIDVSDIYRDHPWDQEFLSSEHPWGEDPLVSGHPWDDSTNPDYT